MTFQCQFLSTKLLFMLLITRTYSVDGQKLCVMSGLHNRIFPWCWETIGGSFLCCGYSSVSSMFCFKSFVDCTHLQHRETSHNTGNALHSYKTCSPHSIDWCDKDNSTEYKKDQYVHYN